MSKVKTHEINPKERYEIIGNLFNVISGLKSKKEIVDFFIGLMTSSEIVMMSRRIRIAQMLINGESYEAIRRKLNVSFQTITTTEKWLHTEDEKHNQWLANRLNHKQDKFIPTEEEKLLDKYSHHRFIKNLLHVKK